MLTTPVTLPSHCEYVMERTQPIIIKSLFLPQPEQLSRVRANKRIKSAAPPRRPDPPTRPRMREHLEPVCQTRVPQFSPRTNTVERACPAPAPGTTAKALHTHTTCLSHRNQTHGEARQRPGHTCIYIRFHSRMSPMPSHRIMCYSKIRRVPRGLVESSSSREVRLLKSDDGLPLTHTPHSIPPRCALCHRCLRPRPPRLPAHRHLAPLTMPPPRAPRALGNPHASLRGAQAPLVMWKRRGEGGGSAGGEGGACCPAPPEAEKSHCTSLEALGG